MYVERVDALNIINDGNNVTTDHIYTNQLVRSKLTYVINQRLSNYRVND